MDGLVEISWAGRSRTKQKLGVEPVQSINSSASYFDQKKKLGAGFSIVAGFKKIATLRKMRTSKSFIN